MLEGERSERRPTPAGRQQGFNRGFARSWHPQPCAGLFTLCPGEGQWEPLHWVPRFVASATFCLIGATGTPYETANAKLDP